jgi:hypothetical protein
MSDLDGLQQDFEAAVATYGRYSPEAAITREALLHGRNDVAKERGLLYLRPLPDVRFAPSDPEPRLVPCESPLLVVNSHLNDPDERPVCFSWRDCALTSFSPPNDDEVASSLMGELGLGFWQAVEVGNSPFVQFLSMLTSTSDLKHYVLLLKDQLFHAVAPGYEILRIEPELLTDVDRGLALISRGCGFAVGTGAKGIPI